MSAKRKTLKSSFLIVLGLALYLFFFTSFALFHAYSNNELHDPKGCSIGQWVQNGQQALLVNIVFAISLLVIFKTRLNPGFGIVSFSLESNSSRAPPFNLFR